MASGTTHSIIRRGIKRCDMNEAELKEILCNLLPLVRTDFILPPYHHVISYALMRDFNMQFNRRRLSKQLHADCSRAQSLKVILHTVL